MGAEFIEVSRLVRRHFYGSSRVGARLFLPDAVAGGRKGCPAHGPPDRLKPVFATGPTRIESDQNRIHRPWRCARTLSAPWSSQSERAGRNRRFAHRTWVIEAPFHCGFPTLERGRSGERANETAICNGRTPRLRLGGVSEPFGAGLRYRLTRRVVPGARNRGRGCARFQQQSPHGRLAGLVSRSPGNTFTGRTAIMI